MGRGLKSGCAVAERRKRLFVIGLRSLFIILVIWLVGCSTDLLEAIQEQFDKAGKKENQSLSVSSFTATYKTVLVQGAERDSTQLEVEVTDAGSIDTYDYRIVSGGGILSGADTDSGKIYSSGITPGIAKLKVTVTDDAGETAEDSLSILVLENGFQKISDNEGGFTGALANSDYFGVSVAKLGDMDGNGVPDLAVGADYDDDGGASSNKGAVWILFLRGDGTVKAHQKISATEGGFGGALSNADNFGTSLANIGDLDGNGVADLAVGATGDDDGGGNNRGAVWILFLKSDGTVKSQQKISDDEGSFDGTLADNDAFGTSITKIGDLDDDGVTDLAVGAPADDDGSAGGNRGAVWILFLKSDGTVRSYQKISDDAGSFGGTLDDNDSFGTSVANMGDLDGDGLFDLAVGAIGDDDGMAGGNRGAVWILFLDDDGTVIGYQKISDTAGSFTGTLANNDEYGSSVAKMGDLDGDGVVDLAVGARYDNGAGSNRGAVWMLFLKSDGTVKGHQKISDTDGNFTGTLEDSDYFGYSVASLGDLDGDNVPDLAVGAFWDDDGGTSRGAVWLLLLNSDGTVLH